MHTEDLLWVGIFPILFIIKEMEIKTIKSHFHLVVNTGRGPSWITGSFD